MNARVNITSPVGRVVMGSLYDPSTTDAEGKPLVVKSGPNAGQPRVNYFFALAIPKEAGHTHWAQTAWGAEIWRVGNQAHPNAAQSPAFAWKLEDGDSQIPNKKGKKPCDNEGWRGHWILKFSGGFAPKVYQAEAGKFVQVMQKDFVKPGYFVEVAFSVEGNGSTSQPGVYLNHSMVCFRAYGQEIVFGPDVSSAGFGGGALPMGATMTPPPSAIPMPQMTPPPGIPSPLPPVGSVPMPAAPAQIAAAPIPVIPNPAFIQVPPPMPAAPVAPPVAAKQMTPAANGIPYEAYIAQGWNDALLIQNGMMLP